MSSTPMHSTHLVSRKSGNRLIVDLDHDLPSHRDISEIDKTIVSSLTAAVVDFFHGKRCVTHVGECTDDEGRVHL